MKASRASVRQAQSLLTLAERLERVEQNQAAILEKLDQLLAAPASKAKAPAPKKEASDETKS